MKQRIDDLEQAMTKPDFWDDPQGAAQVTRELDSVKGRLETWETARSTRDDLEVLFELADEEDDEATRAEVAEGMLALEADVEALELAALLSGEYDDHNAIVSVQSGAGG